MWVSGPGSVPRCLRPSCAGLVYLPARGRFVLHNDPRPRRAWCGWAVVFEASFGVDRRNLSFMLDSGRSWVRHGAVETGELWILGIEVGGLNLGRSPFWGGLLAFGESLC